MAKTSNRASSAAALAVTGLLLLTSCAAAELEPQQAGTTPTEEAATSTTEAVENFPVGEPFGDAKWSVNVNMPSTGSVTKMRDLPVKVRGDRLIVESEGIDGARGVVVFDQNGGVVWNREFSKTTQIAVLDRTVAFLEESTVQGSGLEKDGTSVTLTLLSQNDGSTVAEITDPDLTTGNSITDFGEIVTVGEPRRYITEDGEIREAQQYPEQLVSDIPGLEEGIAEIVPIDPGIEELEEAFEVKVRALSRQQNVALIQVGYGARPAWVTYAVNAESGDVITKLNCDNADYSDSDTNIMYSSPNGKYGVLESYWVTSDTASCYSSDEQTKGVEFSAVDDDGTAYGVTSESDAFEPELAAITADGDVDVTTLPNGASAPVGIMDGGIAIHVKENMITGNPIK